MKADKNGLYHDFDANVKWSSDLSHEEAWMRWYRGYWPNLLHAVLTGGKNEFQSRGVDRIIILPDGREIRIDEKKRRYKYPDILLEPYSVCDRRRNPATGRWQVVPHPRLGWKPGWTVDPKKDLDFVAYCIVPNNVAYLLPFELLRLTTLRHIQRWKGQKDFRGQPAWPKFAPNKGYWTANVAVDPDDLWESMRETAQQGWKGDLTLTAAQEHGRQMFLEWDGLLRRAS